MTYKPEIDSLRAISVLAIIVYHAKIYFFNSLLFPGGYYGVDIFFVISGYLITAIIIKEKVNNNKFSFKNFYLRRARRIFPALILVLIISLPLAWYSLMPYSLIEYAKSIIYSIIFVSNFFFYFTGLEYGAVSGLLKPLLHTWSLSVEEQFYLFFPIILVVLINYFKNKIFVPIFFIVILSLIFAQSLFIFNQNLNFYLLPSRIWELLFGSLLFLYQKNNILKISNIKSDVFCIIGIILIFISFNYFYEVDPSPNIKTIIPIFGAALIIIFAKKDATITKILTNKIILSVGLISYSLYLFHYPIFAFVRNVRLADSSFDYFLVAIVIFILSTLSYNFIEKPFRDKKKIPDNIFLYVVTFLISVLILLSIMIIKNNGFQKRFPSLNSFSTDYEMYLKKDRDLKYKLGNPKFEKMNKKNVLIIGNSHGRDTFNALYLNKELFTNYQFSILDTQISCLENIFYTLKICDKKLSNSQKNILNESEIILLSTSFKTTDIDKLEKIIESILKNKKRVILFNQKPHFYFYNNFSLVDEFFLKFNRLPNEEEKINMEKKYFDSISQETRKINTSLKSIAQNKEIKLFNKVELFCNELKRRCKYLTDDNYKLFYDHSHYTIEGSKYIGKKIYELQWFR